MMHTPSSRPSKTDPTGISCVVPHCSHIDHTEHDLDCVVTEQGLADLRGLAPKDRARRIIEKCAHPEYKAQLTEYLNIAEADCLKRKVGHEPQLWDRAFKMHLNLERNGTMTTWPSKLIICIFWPALRWSDSRIRCGMTTWNFGDSVTVSISFLLLYDDSAFDGLCQPHGLKLPQKPRVILIKQPDVIDPMPEHGDFKMAVDARKAVEKVDVLVLLGIVRLAVKLSPSSGRRRTSVHPSGSVPHQSVPSIFDGRVQRFLARCQSCDFLPQVSQTESRCPMLDIGAVTAGGDQVFDVAELGF